MSLLRDLSAKYKTLSIVGMAKNAGKTTALNYLIEEAADEGIRLGITSTGRDGENTDLVTGSDKPKVFLYEDTIVSVPVTLYDLAEAGMEIVKRTKYRTSLGEILLCRVRDSGYVQVAGPVAVADTKKMCGEIFDLGCKMIFIDGAVDRKSIASPESSDGIILATGAVLSRSLDKVAEETAHIVGLYSLPVLEEGWARTVIEKGMGDERIALIKTKGTEKLDLSTGLGSSRYIESAIDGDTKYVYIPGAFTDSVISGISSSKLRRVRFVLKDPSKIFIDSVSFRRLVKKGLRISVLSDIDVAAVTVNPCSPEGYSFDHEALLGAVRRAIPGIPVIDVRM